MWIARLLPVAVVCALLYPLTWSAPRDSFPLSSYPMFARAQTSPVMSLEYFVIERRGEGRVYVAPEYVANAEVLQARAVIARAARGGRSARQRLCEQVAARLAEAGVRVGGTLRMVRGKHDAVAYLTGRDTSGKEQTLAECWIGGIIQ